MDSALLTPTEIVRKQMSLAFLLLAFCGSSLLAQDATPSTSGNAQSKVSDRLATYDVVSLKPHKKDSPDSFSGWRSNASGIAGTDVSVRSLIMTAYHLIMPDQISGLPAWVDSDTFDFEGKLDPENAEALAKASTTDRENQNNAMLRALLADRFKLKISQSRKELPVYDLVIAKGGPRLKQADSSGTSSYNISVGSVCTLKTASIDATGLATGIANFAG